MIRSITSLKLVSILALALTLPSCGGGATKVQGWSDADRFSWYEATQGSRMMPYAWFKALEQPGSAASFADPAYLEQFGYLRSRADRADPLPVGFAIDRQGDDGLTISRLRWYAGQTGRDEKDAEPWVGLNCAACHTGEIAYNNQPIRIDGGPAMGDYQRFVEEMDAALANTLADAARFDRFAGKVLAGKDTPENRSLLKEAMTRLDGWQKRTDRQNETALRYGFARVDAFGHIYNKVAMFNGAEPQLRSPADAPVSYPFLWNITLQKRVQWNGAASNAKIKLPGGPLDYGALGRNAGEVVGVFGDVAVRPIAGTTDGLKGFVSSVNVENLGRMEILLDQLKPPIWPAELPPIDQALAKRGDALFDQKCASCHLPQDTWKKGEPTERMLPLRDMGADLTDPWMACNAATYAAFSGKLEGVKASLVSGKPLGRQSLIVSQLATTVKGVLFNRKSDIIELAVETFFGVNGRPRVLTGDDDGMTPAEIREERRAFCVGNRPQLAEDASAWDAVKDILAYKARPLDGIWATAPYLHNGSVPTLYHLLLPPAQRPTSFWLGSKAYDPKFVGYVWKDRPEGRAFEFQTQTAGGKPLDGNGNQGHVYGVDGLSEVDRWALVEYMKTL